MAFIPVPFTLQVNIRAQYDTQLIENVLNFKKEEGWLEAEALVFLEDLQTWLAVDIVDRQVTTYAYQEFYATQLDTDDGWTLVHDLTGLTGTEAGDGLPSTNAAVITHYTNKRGRSYRGRTYLAGIPDGYVVRSTIGSTHVAALTNAFNDLRAVAIDHGAVFVVVSRQHDNAPRVTGVTTPVNSSVCQPVIATQRRRRVGTGL